MLRIKTFAETGVSCFFKALGHIEIQPQLKKLLEKLRVTKDFAIYDPEGRLEEFMDLTGIESMPVVYVQKLEMLDKPGVKLISEYKPTKLLLILAFDAKRYQDHIAHLVNSDCEIISLDQIRLPDSMLVNKTQYLNPLNWATNFVWFKEQAGVHTKLVTANYWVKYGAKDVKVYCYLLDQNGKEIKRWVEALPNKLEIFSLDSKEVRARFGLNEFFGQVYVHYVGIAGHDVVKYALDVYGDDEAILSATHDANSWPCRYFAGLPAPKADEKVTLWLQNTHPVPVKPGSVSLNLMGKTEDKKILAEIPPYGMLGVDISEYFPGVHFPAQIELNAGNYFVRPRYEIDNIKTGRNCISHINVERDNLLSDPNIKNITSYIGKGYILSAPIMPIDRYLNEVLPTPMARSLKNLPLKALIYDNAGQKLASHKFGNLPRDHQEFLDVNALVKDLEFFKIPGNYGNIQLVYDFVAGDDADGWTHAVFKYFDLATGHFADTSFGSHIFNNITTYKGEPQSYKGPPPGLTTGIFLRVGPAHLNSLSYLIYPVSKDWHPFSATEIMLMEGEKEIARHLVKIPANGCYLLDCHAIFGQEVIASLANPHVNISDRTCRLFGYHMLKGEKAFSFDHMFGF